MGHAVYSADATTITKVYHGFRSKSRKLIWLLQTVGSIFAEKKRYHKRKMELVSRLLAFSELPNGKNIFEAESSLNDEIAHTKDSVITVEKLNQQATKSNQLVWFYADWCGPCQNFNKSKEWEKLKALKEEKCIDVELSSVNCAKTENENLRKKAEVTSFPSFVFLPKDKIVGNHSHLPPDCREHKQFVEYLEKKLKKQ